MKDVIDVIADELCKDPQVLTADRTLDSMGVDSLRAISILYRIEDHFTIEISNEVVQKIETIGDIIRAVEAQL